MGNYDSFKKDWDNTKKEMEKIGVKKPAEKKSIGIGILKFDKRVASGIGKALKAMDEVEPKDPKKVTEKEPHRVSQRSRRAAESRQIGNDLVGFRGRQIPR